VVEKLWIFQSFSHRLPRQPPAPHLFAPQPVNQQAEFSLTFMECAAPHRFCDVTAQPGLSSVSERTAFPPLQTEIPPSPTNRTRHPSPAQHRPDNKENLPFAIPDLDRMKMNYDASQPDPFLDALFQHGKGVSGKDSHHWHYNFQSLRALLLRAGYTHVERREGGVGDCPDVEKIDRRPESLFAEAYK
jgi:hypothetical protein